MKKANRRIQMLAAAGLSAILSVSGGLGKAQGIELGKTQGIELGKAQGMRALIETCQDLGASREVALFSLKKQFSLSEEEAERQLDKFWPVSE